MMNTRAIANRYSHILRTADADAMARGMSWYAEARATVADIASDAGVTTDTAAMVVAALSPRVHWSRNIRQARELLATGEIDGLGTNRDRAINSLTMGINAFNPKTAPKTRAFALNLMGDETAVTIDVWMMRGAGIPDSVKLTSANRYAILSDIVTRLAHRNGLTPAQAQAIIWIAARGKAD